ESPAQGTPPPRRAGLAAGPPPRGRGRARAGGAGRRGGAARGGGGAGAVGVARQYCGQVGKQDNCRVAVSLSVTTKTVSLPVAWRLYLPESWAQDPERRGQAGVPEEITFATKPAIALKQIGGAVEEGIPT